MSHVQTPPQTRVRAALPPGEIEVEFFGVPRVLVGERSLRVTGKTLEEVATALALACPALVGRVLDAERGWLLGGYIFVVEERFTRDPATRVRDGAAVLLVSSVAGG
ncbi:MAG: thiamine biosynthesis protein ThiS [Chloroflexota bacterium]|nr:thiamine biosynthesis protein ThiS [Chloroflexota bacterium]